MARHPRESPASSTFASRELPSGNGSPTMPSISPNCENIRVELQDVEMWQTFTTGLTNEMIITKSGRKLFPIMRLKIRGLDPSRMYSVSMDFHQVGQNRYKYTDGGWSPAGKAEPQPAHCTYVHHKSPNYGRFWMTDLVDFSKIKVSNKKSDDKIWLNSLHMYEPRLSICRIDPLAKDGEVMVLQKKLEICSFMAVTSYQNEEVTKLKIKHNPFAKGFQDSRTFRNRVEMDDGQISPPAYTATSGQALNPQVSSAWPSAMSILNTDALQTQNVYPSIPSSFSAAQHQSHRYNPYSRVKSERGYSLDFTPPHLASSSILQRRHASNNSAGSATYNRVQKTIENQPFTGYGAIDLSGSNHTDPYSPTVSSTQFTYGQDAVYSQAMYNVNAYYVPSPYNGSMYSNVTAGGSYNARATDQQQHGALKDQLMQFPSNDSGSNSSGSPVDVSLVLNHDAISSSQNVLY